MQETLVVLSMVLLTTIFTFIVVIYMLMTRSKLTHLIKKYESNNKDFIDELTSRLNEITKKNGKK